MTDKYSRAMVEQAKVHHRRRSSGSSAQLQSMRSSSANSFSDEFIVATSGSASVDSPSAQPTAAAATTTTGKAVDTQDNSSALNAMFQNSTATIQSGNSHKRRGRSASRSRDGGMEEQRNGITKSISSATGTRKSHRSREEASMSSSVANQSVTSRSARRTRASSFSAVRKENDDLPSSSSKMPSSQPRKVRHQTSSGSKSTAKPRRSSSVNKHRTTGSHSTTTTAASTASRKPNSAQDFSHLATPRRPGGKTKLRIPSSNVSAATARSTTASETSKIRSREVRQRGQRDRVSRINPAQLPPEPTSDEEVQREVVFKGWSQDTSFATFDKSKDKDTKKSAFGAFGIAKMVGKGASKLRSTSQQPTPRDSSSRNEPTTNSGALLSPKSKKLTVVSSAFKKVKGLVSTGGNKGQEAHDDHFVVKDLDEERPKVNRRLTASKLMSDNSLPEVFGKHSEASRGRRARRAGKGMDSSSANRHAEDHGRRSGSATRRQHQHEEHHKKQQQQQQPPRHKGRKQTRSLSRSRKEDAPKPSRAPDAPKTVGAGVSRPKLGKAQLLKQHPAAPSLGNVYERHKIRQKSNSMRDVFDKPKPSRKLEAPQTVGAGVSRPKLGKAQLMKQHPAAFDEPEDKHKVRRKSHSMLNLMSSNSSIGHNESEKEDKPQPAPKVAVETQPQSPRHHYLTPDEDMEVDDTIPRLFSHHGDDDDVLLKFQRAAESRAQELSEEASEADDIIDDDIFPTPPGSPVSSFRATQSFGHPKHPHTAPTPAKPKVKIPTKQQPPTGVSKPTKTTEDLVHPLTAPQKPKPKVQLGNLVNSSMPKGTRSVASTASSLSSKPPKYKQRPQSRTTKSKAATTLVHPHTAPTGPKPKLSFSDLLNKHKKHPNRLLERTDSISATDFHEGRSSHGDKSQDDEESSFKLHNPFQEEHDLIERAFEEDEESCVQLMSMSDSFLNASLGPSSHHDSRLSSSKKSVGMSSSDQNADRGKARLSIEMLYSGAAFVDIPKKESPDAEPVEEPIVDVVKQVIDRKKRRSHANQDDPPTEDAAPMASKHDAAPSADVSAETKDHTEAREDPEESNVSAPLSSYNPMSALKKQDGVGEAEQESLEQSTTADIDERSSSHQSRGRKGLLRRASNSLRSLKEAAASAPSRLLGEKSRSLRSLTASSLSGHKKKSHRETPDSSALLSQQVPTSDAPAPTHPKEMSGAHHSRTSLDVEVDNRSISSLTSDKRRRIYDYSSVSDLATSNAEDISFKTPHHTPSAKVQLEAKTPRIQNLTNNDEKITPGVNSLGANLRNLRAATRNNGHDSVKTMDEDSTILDDSQQWSYKGSSHYQSEKDMGAMQSLPTELDRNIYTVVSEGTDGTGDDQTADENSTIGNTTFATLQGTLASDLRISDGSTVVASAQDSSENQLEEADDINETEHEPKHGESGEFQDSISSLTSWRQSARRAKTSTIGATTIQEEENDEDDTIIDDDVRTAGMQTSLGSMSFGLNDSIGNSFSQIRKVLITEELDPLPDDVEPSEDDTINDTYHMEHTTVLVSESTKASTVEVLVTREDSQEEETKAATPVDVHAELETSNDEIAATTTDNSEPGTLQNDDPDSNLEADHSENIQEIVADHGDDNDNDASFCKSQLLDADLNDRRAQKDVVPSGLAGSQQDPNYFSQSVEMTSRNSFSTYPGDRSSQDFGESSNQGFDAASNNSHMATTVKRGVIEAIPEQTSDHSTDGGEENNPAEVDGRQESSKPKTKLKKRSKREHRDRHHRRKGHEDRKRKNKGHHRKRTDRTKSRDMQDTNVKEMQEALHQAEESLADSTLADSANPPIVSRGTASRLASSRSFSVIRNGHPDPDQQLPKRAISMRLAFPRAKLDDGLHEERSSRADEGSTADFRPLYHRPNLEDHARQRRQRDIKAMGGIPSFYDDDLYHCFDFIEKAKDSQAPRMTAEGDYDEYEITAPLQFRQWQGFPRIPAPIPSDFFDSDSE